MLNFKNKTVTEYTKVDMNISLDGLLKQLTKIKNTKGIIDVEFYPVDSDDNELFEIWITREATQQELDDYVEKERIENEKEIKINLKYESLYRTMLKRKLTHFYESDLFEIFRDDFNFKLNDDKIEFNMEGAKIIISTFDDDEFIKFKVKINEVETVLENERSACKFLQNWFIQE